MALDLFGNISSNMGLIQTCGNQLAMYYILYGIIKFIFMQNLLSQRNQPFYENFILQKIWSDTV